LDEWQVDTPDSYGGDEMGGKEADVLKKE